MLGDAVRRRTRRGQREPRAGSRTGRPSRAGRIARIAAAAILPFAVGYILAVRLVFPAPDVGPQGITVPSLDGLGVDEASRELSARGLGALAVTPLPHPTAPTGTITAQSPLAGQQLAPGQTVRVAVSSGAPHVVVPDVVGFPIERAASLLTRLGFQIQRVEETSMTERGRVLRLDPPPGAERALPARITLYVSAGPPAHDPQVDTVRAGAASAGPARH